MRIENAPLFEINGRPQFNPGLAPDDNKTGPDFKGFLDNAINGINALSAVSRAHRTDLLTGDLTDIHSMMIAGERSGLAQDLMMAVRNKVLESYQEVMRSQI